MKGYILALALATTALIGLPADAQVYGQNPTYIPTASLNSTTVTATGSTYYTLQGVSTATVRLTGTNTGLLAVVEVINQRDGSPTWVQLSGIPIGSAGTGRVATLSGNGFWKFNTAGYTNMRVRVTQLSSGSATINIAATPSPEFVLNTEPKRPTYSASVAGLVPASAATDLFTVTGNATTTVRITKAWCSGVSTANADATLEAVLRSAADTGGTHSAPTIVSYDQNNPTASATVLAYTANPTVGAAIGVVAIGDLTTNTAAASSVPNRPLVWEFGNGRGHEIVLRGAAQVFAINGVAGTFSAGTALNCTAEWTEE